MPARELELEDDRARRRDITCAATGLLLGGSLGALASTFVPGGTLLPTMMGALAGGLLSKLMAMRISADDWDPRFNRRPYVGTRSPDDDAR